jgi:hypothetical protein
VFGQHEGACFKDENAVAMGIINIEEVRRGDASETPSTNYNVIKWSGIRMDSGILAGPCLVQRIADKAPDIIERKVVERVTTAMGVSPIFSEEASNIRRIRDRGNDAPTFSLKQVLGYVSRVTSGPSLLSR